MDYSTRIDCKNGSIKTGLSSTSRLYHNNQADCSMYPHNFGMNELNMYADNKTANCRCDADIGDGVKNSSFGTYPTKQSLNSVNSMIDQQQPRKGSLWQSMLRSMTSLVGEHLSRGTGSFIRNWSSNMSSPLSVTVVSPDLLYKSLHQNGHNTSDETTMVVSSETNNPFTMSTWLCNKDSTNSNETLASVLYDNEIVNGSVVVGGNNVDGVKIGNESCVGVSDLNDVDKRWREYKCMYIDFNKSQHDTSMSEEDVNCFNTMLNEEREDEALESQYDIIINSEKDLDKSTNFGSTLSVDDEPVILELYETEPESECPVQSHENQESQSYQQQQQTQNQATKTPPSVSPQTSIVGSILTNAYNKVVSGMADLLQLGSTSPESEPTAHFTKRAGPCTKPKPKKLHVISSGRGRGRAKSQLRRSGVSQKRHRKQRSRYDRFDEIDYEIKNWEDMENYMGDEEIESMDVCDFSGNITNMHKRPSTLTLDDIKPTIKKPKRKNGFTNQNHVPCMSKFPTKLNLTDNDSDEDEYDDEDEDDEDSEDDDMYSDDDEDDDSDSDVSSGEEVVHFSSTTRIRLSSISSVDSDDSFVVFNDGISDVEIETETKTETEAEDKNENSGDDSDFDIETWQPSKIRFNLTPTVHTIVHWRFAYKAARRGPWEEMARDRARFRKRIHEADVMLQSVFGSKHRTRIWNERFADNAAHICV